MTTNSSPAGDWPFLVSPLSLEGKISLLRLLFACCSARALVRLDSFSSFNSSYHVEGTDDFAAFELSERICSVVRGLRGEHFRGMELITTHTNHNHEELLENIDVYKFLGQITRE